MATAAATLRRRYEPEDLLEMDDEGIAFELNDDGTLEERAMSNRSSEVGATFLRIIGIYVYSQKLGRVFGSDLLMRFWPDFPRRVRSPDVAFVAAGRIPVDAPDAGFLEIPPDLIVEVSSPNDIADKVERKVREYLDGGVRLLWVVYPETRTVLVRRPGGADTTLTEDDMLEGEDVLPGFSVPVRDLFPE
jgi:Uma2 family endonuclease